MLVAVRLAVDIDRVYRRRKLSTVKPSSKAPDHDSGRQELIAVKRRTLESDAWG